MCVQTIRSNYFGVVDNRPHKAVILKRRESIVVRSTFTLAFLLEALSKLGHKNVESKESVTVLLGAGNKDWRLGLLRWWEIEGQGARNEKATWRSSRNMARDLFVFGWILNCSLRGGKKARLYKVCREQLRECCELNVDSGDHRVSGKTAEFLTRGKSLLNSLIKPDISLKRIKLMYQSINSLNTL